MPHLIIQYSKNLDTQVDMQSLCEQLRGKMIETGIFPLGGIRVRAFAADTCAIADAHPDNAFADMMLRIGAGRSLADKKNAGDLLVETARHFFAAQLDESHFALSFEIVEIDPDLSWKINSIHPRLKQ